MNTTGINTRFVRAAISCVAAAALCAAPDASAQEKQKISYKVGAENSRYTQRHTLDVGDEPGHQIVAFEIHRTFPGDGPKVGGVKIKEIWTRGYADYPGNNNGLSNNYGIYVLENGDKFYTFASTMGQADAAGRRETVSVGQVRGGTGKLVGMRGMIRSKGVSDGKKGYNETNAEIEYWFAK